MGLKPYLIADALTGIVGQRLVRTICPYCKHEIKLPTVFLDKVREYGIDEESVLYAGEGCSHCDFTGYYGRTMVSEILIVDEQITKLIAENANKVTITEYALESKNYEPMIYDGIRKAINGITTIEEVLRVIKE
jgi:type II secretory ATPase GspE/PulE/Tfp pilus assembly ATPase PilB-like protein